MSKRVEQLCSEFDERIDRVGVGMARHWWAARLAEAEGENERLRDEKDAWKRTANTMEEVVDNVRAALELESTHYLIIHDQVAEVVAENTRLRTLNAELVKSLDSAICWMDALPHNKIPPDMPTFYRDWAEVVLAKAEAADGGEGE